MFYPEPIQYDELVLMHCWIWVASILVGGFDPIFVSEMAYGFSSGVTLI